MPTDKKYGVLIMKSNRCRVLALTLLRDADDDVRGRDSRDPDNIIIYKVTAESKRKKANAINFFYSKESEEDARFWCDIAGQPLERFRRKLQKYKQCKES
jgi:hypothetical protein